MYKKLPFILIVIIIASILLNPIIPVTTKQIIYACSITTKSLVLFLLPFIIFGLLFKTFAKLAGNALSIVYLIFECLCLLEFPVIIKNEYALFGGMISGILCAFFIKKRYCNKINKKIDTIMQKLFSFISVLIPFFIIGFVIKCASGGTLTKLMKSYSIIFVIFFAYASVYAFLFYFLVSEGKFKKCINYIKNMIPAFVTAISKISSALTMPITIICADHDSYFRKISRIYT